MKQILFLLLWIGWGVAIGQKIPTDSTKTNKALTNTDAFLPKITPKSPIAAALGRYGDIPVSLYTGLPTIEIPLFEFAVDGMKVPIKLMYHAGGMKVSDQASWVGMGWSLQTGGMVSRNIMGLRDEQLSALPGLGPLISRDIQALPSLTATGGCLPNAAIQEVYNAMAENRVDGQRDVFTYRTPTGSNSFILGPTLTGETNPVTFLVPERSRVLSTTALTSFTLVNESGVTFRFNDTEGFSNNASSGNVTTWLLNEIVGLNPSQRAVYSYTGVAPTTANDLTESKTFQDQVSGTSPPAIIANPGPVNQNNDNTTSQNLLTQITFPGGKIQFTLQNRTLPDESAGAYVTAVSLYGLNVDNTYTLIKKYAFNYVYKARSGGDNVLFLSSIGLLDATGISTGLYSFTYNDATPLPEQSSKARDFWGYFNGQTSNMTLLPPLSIPWQPTAGAATETLSIPGANRSPNAASMKAWIIKRMGYPTGGYTDFEFEPHQYDDGSGAIKLAGGLRIHQMRSYSGSGTLAQTKTYTYGTNGTGRARFGRPFATDPKPEIHQTGQLVKGGGSSIDAPEYGYRQRTFSSVPSYPLSAAEGSPVTYSLVTEYEDDGSATIGKTVYIYRDKDSAPINDADDPNYTNGRMFVQNTAWNRGQLVSKTVFDAANRKKYRQENEYVIFVGGTTNNVPAGLLVSYGLQYESGAPAGRCSSFYPNEDGISFAYIPRYTFNFGQVRLIRSRDYQYDDADDSRYTLKTTETDYSTRHYQPTETRAYVQGGAIVGTRYSYPQDFTYTIGNQADIELLGIKTLQNQNVYQSVETISFRQNVGDVRKYKTGQLTTYRPVTVAGQSIALPHQVYGSETDFNNKNYITGGAEGPYNPSAEIYNANSSTATTNPRPDEFPLDFVWQKPRLTMNTYDADGNLTNYSVTAGMTIAYTYATLPQMGGGTFSYVTGETKNYGVPLPASAQTTTFAYAIPLLGVSTITDPRGVYSTYEYDKLGRLLRIKDQQGKILKQFSYRFTTSTEPQP